MPRRRFTIPATIANISPTVEATLAFLAKHRAILRRRHAVEVSLREALANAVTHGSQVDPRRTVTLVVSLNPSRDLRITVRDTGPGFDPRAVPDPLHHTNLYSDGGRGLYLIRTLMDRVAFARGGSEIRLWKKAPRPGGRARRRRRR